ncbi:hypothetical protein DUI87_28550 [Hirundo rustica rustica]|uniref:Uncharacterized protein n=1 Tax=Hirundo rustica rustica TaxID=333673 RepID=A0A3M0J1S9_HIRRU|nr:hypothetical protein DUI87_28550 [Hirundo rustica rustica]
MRYSCSSSGVLNGVAREDNAFNRRVQVWCGDVNFRRRRMRYRSDVIIWFSGLPSPFSVVFVLPLTIPSRGIPVSVFGSAQNLVSQRLPWHPLVEAVGEDEAKKPYKYDCLYSENVKPVGALSQAQSTEQRKTELQEKMGQWNKPEEGQQEWKQKLLQWVRNMRMEQGTEHGKASTPCCHLLSLPAITWHLPEPHKFLATPRFLLSFLSSLLPMSQSGMPESSLAPTAAPQCQSFPLPDGGIQPFPFPSYPTPVHASISALRSRMETEEPFGSHIPRARQEVIHQAEQKTAEQALRAEEQYQENQRQLEQLKMEHKKVPAVNRVDGGSWGEERRGEERRGEEEGEERRGEERGEERRGEERERRGEERRGEERRGGGEERRGEERGEERRGEERRGEERRGEERRGEERRGEERRGEERRGGDKWFHELR